MARSTTVTLIDSTWTEITDGTTTTAVTFQSQTGAPIYIMGTNGGTAPTTLDGAFIYQFAEGEKNTTIADVFLGVSGADRLWGYGVGGGLKVSIQHA